MPSPEPLGSALSGAARLPPGMGFGRAFVVALLGTLWGCLAVVALATVLDPGLVLAFVLWPGYALALLVLSLLAALVTATVTRLWRRLPPRAVQLIAAVLTFGSFYALVLRIAVQNSRSGRW